MSASDDTEEQDEPSTPGSDDDGPGTEPPAPWVAPADPDSDPAPVRPRGQFRPSPSMVWHGVVPPGADVTSAVMSQADLSDSGWTDVVLSFASLDKAILIRANFSRADMQGVNAVAADFTDAILRGADLRLANASDALLRKADLRDANLVGADLRGADLTGADLTGAAFDLADVAAGALHGVVWDSSTRWPTDEVKRWATAASTSVADSDLFVSDRLPSEQPLSTGLSELDRAMLTFERHWWKYAGAKEQAVREKFDMSSTRYYQVLNALIDRPQALAYDSLLVRRLRRLRASRQRRQTRTRGGLSTE